MPEIVIEFHGDGARPFPRPVPAVQETPDWLKRMPADADLPAGGTVQTVKKCPPFVDALTGGYLIPLIADVEFRMESDGLKSDSELPVIETHSPQQFLGSPMQGRTIVKFMNPWIVKTPPGWSCLFVQPLNRFDLPFHILSGIVETDTYYREIAFPSICTMRPGESVLLKRGTPIAQLFPLRRESWRAEYSRTRLEERGRIESEFGEGWYREHHWERKDFK